jgi:hypothetical protein
MADNTNRNVIKKPTTEIIQAFEMLTAVIGLCQHTKCTQYGGVERSPRNRGGQLAESDREFDCAYRIHFNSRSADERLESTGRLPGSPEHVE